MLVHKNYLLPEVQKLLDSFYAVHLGLTNVLPPVSAEAKVEALRIWRNRRRELLSHIREGIAELHESNSAIGQTYDHYFVLKKGKFVWLQKPDLKRLKDQIHWYNSSEFYPETEDLYLPFSKLITAPPDGYIFDTPVAKIEDVAFAITSSPPKKPTSKYAFLLGWPFLNFLIWAQISTTLIMKIEAPHEALAVGLLLISLFISLFRNS